MAGQETPLETARRARDTAEGCGVGASVLSAGGFAAAFGAATCCALPLLLGGFGFGAAWLGVLALIFAPYRFELLTFAVAALAIAVGLLWRRRAALRGCELVPRSGERIAAAFTLSATILGTGLVALGFWYD